MKNRPVDQIDVAIIHCSDSVYGNVDLINGWHRERFSEPCGYHFVITNCYPTLDSYNRRRPQIDSDGAVHAARDLDVMGTHCKGNNWRSIGICLIGKTVFTSRQLSSLQDLVLDLRKRLGVNIPIAVHNQFNTGKTCPEISWPMLHGLIDN